MQKSTFFKSTLLRLQTEWRLINPFLMNYYFNIIHYKNKTNFNHFLLFQGKDLPAKDLSGTSDPYVRVTLLPDKKHRLETKIKRRTLNPRWNETFYFEGFPIQKLQSRVLHLHVFDYDRFSRDDSIGEVFLPLCQVSSKRSKNEQFPLNASHILYIKCHLKEKWVLPV